MKTTFYVYKVGKSYIKVNKNLNPKEGEKMLTLTLVKDIDNAAYWKDKRDAKSWMVERQYPNVKLIPCGLSERNKIKNKK